MGVHIEISWGLQMPCQVSGLRDADSVDLQRVMHTYVTTILEICTWGENHCSSWPL
jgi:hypothetical protein